MEGVVREDMEYGYFWFAEFAGRDVSSAGSRGSDEKERDFAGIGKGYFDGLSSLSGASLQHYPFFPYRL